MAVNPVDDIRAALAVTTAAELVEFLNLLVYGDPGAGKTWLAGTAEDSQATRPVLFLDVEGGVITIRHRGGIDVKPIRSARELMDTYNMLFKSIRDGSIFYKTVVIDSLTELSALIMKDIMELAWSQNPDKVNKDVPSQREWGIAREQMRRIVRAFRDLPCHVIYTASVGTLQEQDQPVKYFPGFAGKLRTDIPGFMDIVGYMSSKNVGGTITRTMQLAQTSRVVAKDRTSALGDMLENPTIPMIWELISQGGVDSTTTPSKG